MTVVKAEGGGYQIKSHTKKEHVYPKVYKTPEEAQKRIDEMTRHSKKPVKK